MNKILIIVSVLSLFFFSCEEELENFTVTNVSNAIVVSGEISNLEGPYIIRLNKPTSYSPYDVREFTGIPVSGATVKVTDNLGNIFDFTERYKGVYESSSIVFKGIVGNSYTLHITTKEGQKVQSKPSKILPITNVSKFDYDFELAEKVEETKFVVKTIIKDALKENNYYLIKRQDYIEFMATCPPPPPPPQNPPTCYSRCWRAPLNTQPMLFDDFLIDGKDIKTQIGQIPLEDITNYAIDLKVYNMEKDHYQYWKRLEDQRLLTGSIFDKVPAQILGNLSCTNDPSLEVLGYFGAVSINKKRLVIDRFSHLKFETIKNLNEYVVKKEIRNPKKEISNCWEASWIDYNIGLEIPPFKD